MLTLGTCWTEGLTRRGLLKGKAGVSCALTTCQACPVRVLTRCGYFHLHLSIPTSWGCSGNPLPRWQTLCMRISLCWFPCPLLLEPHTRVMGSELRPEPVARQLVGKKDIVTPSWQGCKLVQPFWRAVWQHVSWALKWFILFDTIFF